MLPTVERVGDVQMPLARKSSVLEWPFSWCAQKCESGAVIIAGYDTWEYRIPDSICTANINRPTPREPFVS
jgi:hypothetical protein